jgi:hypothetical protein
MSTLETTTIATTIDAPFKDVTADLADPTTHPLWATEFFSAPATEVGDGIFRTEAPRLGGPTRIRVEADQETGVIDLYLAPEGAEFGPPLPIRVVANGDGVDVLFTLARFPGVSDEDWSAGLDSMRRELEQLRARHEGYAQAQPGIG